MTQKRRNSFREPRPSCGRRRRGAEASRFFRKAFFPGVTRAAWEDWRWQLSHAVRREEELDRFLNLSAAERSWFARPAGPPLAITPYYLSLLCGAGPDHPLRRCAVPTVRENFRMVGEQPDPLAERAHEVVPGLIHTYPDKVLWLVTSRCPTYCRFCVRRACVGRSVGWEKRDAWAAALEYVGGHREIRDVLISGGDPLVLGDETLAWLLGALRRLRHVELIRLGTRAPAVLPQRITGGLLRTLRRFHPVWMSVHFAHPEELTEAARQACERLADAGVPLMNQTVLLAGVNDRPEVIKRLMLGLLQVRVRPYYLHQCDWVPGVSHFRAPLERGWEIIRSLVGHTSGYAVPLYVAEAVGGGGKVPVMPSYVAGRMGDELLLRNYRGELCRYRDAGLPEPCASSPSWDGAG